MIRNAAFSPAPQLNERLATLTTPSDGTLQLTAVRNRHAVLLSVVGEIDALNTDMWECALTEVAAAADASSLLLVDARQLDFMSSVGFAVLAKQACLCGRDDVELRVISTHAVVARVVALCGWENLIPVYCTIDAALAAPTLVATSPSAY